MNRQNLKLGLANLARWIAAHRTDLAVIAFLVALAIKYLYGAMQVLGLDLWDETEYLYNGVHLLQAGLRDPAWAPFYGVWYFLLSHFVPNRIALFYLNLYLVTILPVVALYILLRANQVSLWVSWATAGLLLLISVNLEATQRTLHLALLCILVACVFASRARSTLGALVIITLGSLVAMYFRPEQTITFGFLALVLTAIFLIRWNAEHHAQKVTVAGTYAVIGLTLVGIGIPLSSPLSASHTYGTFLQHFAANWLIHHPNGIDPWTGIADAVPHFFPTAQNIPQAILENPGAFAQHVRWNVATLLAGLAMRPFTTFFFTPNYSRLYEFLVFLAVALLFAFRYRTVAMNMKRRRVIVLTLACALSIVLLSSLIAMPRTTFLFLPIAFLLALSVLLLAGGTAGRSPALWQISVVGLLAFALVPSVNSLRPHQTPNLDAVELALQFDIQKPVVMLTPSGYVGDYFSDNYSYVLVEEINGAQFERFFQDRNINLILLTPQLAHDPRYQSSARWNQFLAQPADFGFVQYDIPKTSNKLLVADSLLNK